MKNLYFVLFTLTLSVGCSTKIVCENPRPEICTREYAPVCATRDTGTRCITEPCPEASEESSYPNGCSACADSMVYHYRSGEC